MKVVASGRGSRRHGWVPGLVRLGLGSPAYSAGAAIVLLQSGQIGVTPSSSNAQRGLRSQPSRKRDSTTGAGRGTTDDSSYTCSRLDVAGEAESDTTPANRPRDRMERRRASVMCGAPSVPRRTRLAFERTPIRDAATAARQRIDRRRSRCPESDSVKTTAAQTRSGSCGLPIAARAAPARINGRGR